MHFFICGTKLFICFKVEGGLTMTLVARAYVVTEDDTILYTDMVSGTYESVLAMS